MTENTTVPAPVDVSIPTAAGDMPARMWLPDSGTGPGVVLFQEIFGVTSYVEDRAGELAGAGYVVVVPVTYWRAREQGPFEGEDDLQKGMATMQEVEWDDAVADGVATLRWLRQRPEVSGKVGVVGFCYGGGVAYNVAALEPVDALVSYYGSALPMLIEAVPAVTAASLHHFGLADSFIDNQTLERIRAHVTASPETEFHTYEGAEHAFDNPDPRFHHAAASAQAWQRTLDFLERTLGG